MKNLILFGVLSLALMGCGKEPWKTPEGTLAQAYTAIQNNDVNGLTACLRGTAAETYGNAVGLQTLKAHLQSLNLSDYKEELLYDDSQRKDDVLQIGHRKFYRFTSKNTSIVVLCEKPYQKFAYVCKIARIEL